MDLVQIGLLYFRRLTDFLFDLFPKSIATAERAVPHFLKSFLLCAIELQW